MTVFAYRGDGRERSLPVQSTNSGCVDTVFTPSEHSVPKGVELSDHGRVWDKQITAIGENRKNGDKD